MATLGLGNFSDVLASIMIHTSHNVCAPVSAFLCIELAHPSSHPWLSTSSLKLLLVCSIFPLLFAYEAFVYFLYSSLVVILQSCYFSSTFILFEAWRYFL
jgi:hypothetical protein